MAPRFVLPAKVSFRLPVKLRDQPSYIGFLKDFAKFPENKKTLAAIEKQDLDKEYESLLRKRFPDEESTVRRHMELSRTSEARTLWDRLKDLQTTHGGPAASYLASAEVASLTMPALVRDRMGETSKGSSDKWNRQSYQAFADKLVKQNSGVEITKQIADDALRFAVSSIVSTSTKAPAGQNSGEMDKMLKRCLGKESDQYWQKRSAS
ncbi:hypothetical protein LTS10_010349 [Elasticomyces elasticus]|nr:hypothetical protein LTS10_010349 [Elasticomyces elasticus]